MNSGSDLFGVILAGGSGSRLWPLSREMHPKQLLKLNNESTLFQSTFLRLAQVIPGSNIVTVTNQKHAREVKMQLNELQQSLGLAKNPDIIAEPVGRNTAPAIGLSVLYILKKLAEKDADPVILIAPSDHLVKCQGEFTEAIIKGADLARAGYIVTFGIKPERPDTGFGYIRTSKDTTISNVVDVAMKVEEFKEKPDLPTAQEYCAQGNYYWNGGIFMFKASTMLNELERYSKEVFDGVLNCPFTEENSTVSYDDYIKIPDISIDYAVMEYSKLITLIPLDCGWNDLGSWHAIYETAQKDERENFISGNVLDIDSENSLIYGTSKFISTIGLKDVVIIETEDAILACNKNRTQDVKKVFDYLKCNNDSACVIHKTVYRPWGHSTVLQKDNNFMVKSLQLSPKSRLSLHVHSNRSEQWVVLSGLAKIVKDDGDIYLKPGESIT
ncbi:MAG TPA: mannose-1-phosphate guanylyltransferase/mannose-6-phosphate isomerase, partial [Cyanobacteria bacterium UBA9579]|nr:mannose-1-phosphate guanylyltransferase/mannose-6-phosphate isomerase [Cyanobacteria bacterium UBA9579]